jgi:hypothetical protein
MASVVTVPELELQPLAWLFVEAFDSPVVPYSFTL